MDPFVSYYTAVSQDLARWLVSNVGIAHHKVQRICNGVDVERFAPRKGDRLPLGPQDFVRSGSILVGTVGRMQTVKDQVTLVRAFIHLVQRDFEARKRLRLVMVGNGPLREVSQELLQAAHVAELAWLPGEREDVPQIMRALDLFVLPSIAEGISNTVLEAMASGLPVVATRVGGTPELIEEGQTGLLVPASDPVALADAIGRYVHDPDGMRRHGVAARRRAESHFSIDRMIDSYLDLYDAICKSRRRSMSGAQVSPTFETDARKRFYSS
jgi:sugar transferase (PEP-CTERM/EpsH1 system associated)